MSRLRCPELALTAMLAFVLGCHLEEPFARTNHWDPGGDARKSLTGPDSTFSIGDVISVTLVGDPPLPPGPLTIEWTSNGAADTAVQVFASGYGTFNVNLAHSEYHPVAVAADFEGAIVAWTVMVGQKLAAFDLFCGSAVAPVACESTPLAVNATRTVNSTMADANTNAIRRRQGIMQRATVAVRDPAVASTAPTTPNPGGLWTVRGLAPGATWIVISADGVRDSVRFVVVP